MPTQYIVKDRLSGAVLLRDSDGGLVDARDAEDPVALAVFDQASAQAICEQFNAKPTNGSRWEAEPARVKTIAALRSEQVR